MHFITFTTPSPVFKTTFALYAITSIMIIFRKIRHLAWRFRIRDIREFKRYTIEYIIDQKPHCTPFLSSWEICCRLQRNCWRTWYFSKIRKFEKTRRVKFQLMILHFYDGDQGN
jgi:hypothetical protein